MGKCIEDCKMFNKYLVISYNKQRNAEMNATNLLQHKQPLCPWTLRIGFSSSSCSPLGAPLSHLVKRNTDLSLGIISSNFPPSLEFSSMSWIEGEWGGIAMSLSLLNSSSL